MIGRRLVMLVTFAVLGSLVSPSSMFAALPDNPNVIYQRFGGAKRYDTALEISKSYDTVGGGIVLATGENYPDAICAAPLAGATRGRVLLVPTTGLTPAIETEIKRVDPSVVYICGSTGVVPPSVEGRIKTITGLTATRLAGSDRYGTCLKIAQTLRSLIVNKQDEKWVFVATGRNYPDALAAGPLAADMAFPIFLCDPAKGLSPAMLTELKRWQPVQTLLLGSTGVVPAGVEKVVPNPERLYGSDRYKTGAAIAAYTLPWFDSFDGMTPTMGLATGENFPDALAAGPRAGHFRSVLFLTQPTSLPDSVRQTLAPMRPYIRWVDVYGSTGVVSDDVVQTLDDILSGR